MSVSVSPSAKSVFSNATGPASAVPSSRPSTKTKSRPVTIRFSETEFTRLSDDACGQSLSGYVRGRLFDPASAPSRRTRRGRYAVQDKAALAQILAMLGKIGASSDLSDLAEGVRLGTLPVSSEVEAQIIAACGDILKVKALLMAALGIAEE